jgi:cell fate regulator YaaT (PSP1 superfamily)
MLAVSFTRSGRLYYLDAGSFTPRVGDRVLFPTSTSSEVAEVVWGPEWVADDIGGLPVCLGIATDADLARDEQNKRRRAEIQVAAQRLIREHRLPMKVSGVDWSDVGHESGRATATVFFTSPGRVDFRQLVRDLAHTLDAKVVLSQLSARDDARVQGGVGPCGRETCCSTFLADFDPVTVRMARDQDLPANPMKISGACGRLMCCLKYEHPLYQEAIDSWPHVGDEVETPEGVGKVQSVNVPGEKLVVRLAANGKSTVCPVSSTCGSRQAYDSRADDAAQPPG